MDVVEKLVTAVEVIMASISFVMETFKFALLFCFYFVGQCSLILLMRSLALSKTWSNGVSETEVRAVLVEELLRLSLNFEYCSALCLSSIARIPFMFLMHS